MPDSSTERSCTPSTSLATSSRPSSPGRGECSTLPAARATEPTARRGRSNIGSGDRPGRANGRHARARYPAAEFVQGDVRQLPFEDGAFELVVSFETIEHVHDPERVLDELRRVLAGDGLLVISTPNKRQYLVENEFHEREFRHEEFVELLRTRFPDRRAPAAAQLACLDGFVA